MIKYNNQAVSMFKICEKEAFNLKSKKIDIEHLLLATLSFENNVKRIFNKNNITYKTFKNELLKLKKIETFKSNSKYLSYALNVKKIIDLSHDNASENSCKEIKLENIFMCVLEDTNNTTTLILKKLNLNFEKAYKALLKSVKSENSSLIFEIGTNLNQMVQSNCLEKVFGRNNEIYQIIKILARKNKNNPILIGEAGVGKTAIVEELARKITNNSVPDFLKNKIIVSINIANVISGTKYRGEFEEKLTNILKECEELDNIILFIDEVHTIVGAGGAEGAIDASNILKPVLARGLIKIIGATTINEYKKYISIDKALDRRFQKVLVEEPIKEQTYKILKKIKSNYEKFHNVIISDNVLKNIVDLSNQYIFDRNDPDKSIDILDEACAFTAIKSSMQNKIKNSIILINNCKVNALKKENFKLAQQYKIEEQELKNKLLTLSNSSKKVKLSTIQKIIESKCNSKILNYSKFDLCVEIEKKMVQEIVGQKKAINQLLSIIKSNNAFNENIPVSIWFRGPENVGKEETIKLFSKLTNRNFIKLEMSEYNNELSINKIIGSPQGYVGYNDTNLTFESLKIYPNSIIYLNKIENAHHSILNLFLQILNSGFLITSKGEKINFKNCIFIINTNDLSKENSIGFINNHNFNDSDNSLDEFKNNINHEVIFTSLSKNHIKEIIQKEIKIFNSNIILNNVDLEKIISEVKFKQYGTKNIKNVLKSYFNKTTTL